MHLPLPQHVHMEELILLPVVMHVNHVVKLSNSKVPATLLPAS